MTTITCPHCKKPLDEDSIRKVLIKELTNNQVNMKKEKRHLSNYSQYMIRNELIEVLKEELKQ